MQLVIKKAPNTRDFHTKEARKKREHDLAIVCGQEAMESLTDSEAEIKYEKWGKPFGKVRGANKSLSLSLSHSYPYIGGAADRNKVLLGLDIEKVRKFPSNFIKGFMTEKEISLYSQFSQRDFDKETSRLWSFKEAILKAIGVGLLLNPRRIDIRAVAIPNKGKIKIYIDRVPFTVNIESNFLGKHHFYTLVVISKNPYIMGKLRKFIA